MSARLANGQNQLYAALDKYKAAVAQLAGVTTSRVAVLSFLADTPPASIVGRRLAAVTPLPATSSSRSLQQASSSSSDGWSWELLPFDPEEDLFGSSSSADAAGGSSSRGLLSAALSAASAAAGRLLLQSGQLEVYSRIATMGQSDADAIVGRINNSTRQAEFEKALADAGLKLVQGSVGVKRAGQGQPGGSWGLPGLNWNDPTQRRIIIIVAASIGAALVAVCLIWWATCCIRRRRRAAGGPRAGLQQQFITSGGRSSGSATPGSQSSGGSGLRPLFGAPAAAAAVGTAAAPAVGRPSNSSNRPLYNPFAAQPAAAATYGASAYALPGAGGARGGAAGQQPPAGGYTVAGHTFATAKEADDYALALALSQSLQSEQSRQQQQPGGFFSRYLPSSSSSSAAKQPSQRQRDAQQQLSGYPPIGFGHGFGATPYR
jgi:hypothetical protein